MDLSVFFENPSLEVLELAAELRLSQLGSRAGVIKPGFVDWKAADLVMMGVGDTREGAIAADAIRMQLYPLSLPHEDLQMADLGNLLKEDSESLQDALAFVLKTLLEAGKVVMVLGEDPSLSYGLYLGFESLKKELSYVHLAQGFALQPPDEAPDAATYNQRILLHEPNYLEDFIHLGYQRYFVTADELKLIQDLSFAAIRYGELSGQTHETEPYLREAHMTCFDLGAIKSSDFLANSRLSPGGFNTMEACQIARYAGLGNQMSTFFISGLQVALDPQQQGAMLAALMYWYFIEGYYQRRPDQSPPDPNRLRRYNVNLHGTVKEIVFLQSQATGRWWMEVPLAEGLGKAHAPKRLVPCSERDYQIAKEDNIPDRWWREFNRGDTSTGV